MNGADTTTRTRSGARNASVISYVVVFLVVAPIYPELEDHVDELPIEGIIQIPESFRFFETFHFGFLPFLDIIRCGLANTVQTLFETTAFCLENLPL